MAEIHIKVGSNAPEPWYQSGDIVEAYNDIRIHDSHAQHITGKWNNEASQWNAELAEMYWATIYQKKVEKISKTEVKTTNLWTLQETIARFLLDGFGMIPFDHSILHRIDTVPHLVFGKPGREVYYDGRTRYRTEDDIYIWQQIETMTAYRKADYGKTFLGDVQLKAFLCLSVDDFSNTERWNLESSVYDDKVNPPLLLQKRKHKIEWWDKLGLTGNVIDSINDKERVVDIRDMTTYDHATVVKVKTPVLAEI